MQRADNGSAVAPFGICACAPPGIVAEQQKKEPAMNSNSLMYADEPDQDTMGGRLSRAREAAGMKAPEFANAVGVGDATLRDWETDRAEPRANRLVAIAGMLNVSPTWLMEGIGQGPKEEEESATITELREQMRRLVDLQEQMKLAIAGMAENIARAEKELS
jgi:transcriptional regulator with XRE-family HTH domain